MYVVWLGDKVIESYECLLFCYEQLYPFADLEGETFVIHDFD